MLPFTALSGCIRLDNGTEREVSVYELAPAYLTFRLCAGEKPREGTEIELHFSHVGRNECETLRFTPDSIRRQQSDAYSAYYRADVKDRGYTAAVTAFSEEYLMYVSNKLELPESGLAAEYTKTDADEETDLPGNLSEFRHGCFEEISAGSGWYAAISSVPERAIILDNPDRYEQFLGRPGSDFFSALLSENGLSGHPAAELTINCVIIGNEYCGRLFPDAETLSRLLEKAESERLHAVVAFSPAGPGDEERVKSILQVLRGRNIEITVNDLGSAAFAREILGGEARLRLGALMNKTLSDPRMKTLYYDMPEAPNGLASADYREYLEKRFGITAYSAFYSSHMTAPRNTAVYLPYCRTNTSLLCTLAAVCETGERGRQHDCADCPMYCRNNVFLYPRGMKMIGAYNSLFYADTESMTDDVKISAGNIDRIVFDLI